MATEEEFALAVSDVAAFADLRAGAGEEPNTYFELTTAAAFAFFADQAINAAVLEVGLGGRLDATNVVDAEVCVLTSIGIEHTEYLGEDVATIAGEKLAIAGANSTLVSGPLPDLALEVADTRARDLGIHHRHYGKDFSVLDAERGIRGWLVTIGGAEDTYEDLFLPLHGRYQLVNLANTVAATAVPLAESVLFEVNPSTVVTVSYPQSSEACADPENIPDEVEGTVVTPPTTPDQVDGVDVLPFTGVHGGALAAVAFGALALGGLMLLSVRRDEAEDS